jgi:hypothetical protein
MNKTFTLTYGDCAENHKGMQIIGKPSLKGYSLEDLHKFKSYFEEKGCVCEIYNLHKQANTDIALPEAYFLLIKNGVNVILNEIGKTTDDFFIEQDSLPKDSKAFMYGRVVNKHARHNLCFGKTYQPPDYEAGKGTIIPFESVPCLEKIRTKFSELSELYKISESSDHEELVVEGNYYYDISKCGIGYHGDSERNKVVGVRLGATLPLCYQWFYHGEHVGDNIRFNIDHGDIYIMCEKAVGKDWKKKNIYTLRHAAGCDKYIKLI